MRVDMTEILNGKTDRILFEEEWEGAGAFFPEVTFTAPVSVKGTVTDRSGYMSVMFSCLVRYSTECARCLEKLDREMTFTAEKGIVSPGSVSEEEAEDYILIEDSAIDLTESVSELLFLELPGRDLCKEDCAGLCPVCGRNLNLGKCGCVRKEVDPRLAGLAKFLTDEDN